ncbi:MAG: OmpH family outer membrane protein [Prevotella sp.]|jgi:outer membrane protein|nr:OmpH family outer membrane protein [Prevotella sp.]
MKRFLVILLTVISLSASAQTTAPVLKFGFLSYSAVLQSMPDYAVVEAQMTQLRGQYAAEQKRVEDEFNKKYEEFLDGQRDFPQTILQKRQSELQELLDKNIAFKKESQRLIAEAEQEVMAPLKARLSSALAKVGVERGLAFIVDTDQQSLVWMNMTMGEDVTELVQKALR